MKRRTHLGMTKKGHETVGRRVQLILDRVLAERPKHGECSAELSRLLTASEYIGKLRTHVGYVGEEVVKFDEQVMKFRNVCLPAQGVATFDGLAGARQRRKKRVARKARGADTKRLERMLEEMHGQELYERGLSPSTHGLAGRRRRR